MDKQRTHDEWVAEMIVKYIGEHRFLSDMKRDGIPEEAINGEDITRVWGLIIEAAANSVR